MATPRFTWTDRARPIVQIGIGYAYVDERSALWDQARWDTPGDVWGGAEPAWRDVACDTFTFRCEYGRQRSTDRFVVGQASVVVWNATGWADPNVADEPGTLTMRPGRAIRVGVEHVNLGTRWLFRGFIDALTPVYSPTDTDTVELSCIDALGEVNRAKLLPLPDPMYAGDSVDVRIARLLDAASWPESKTRLQPTGDTLIATTMGGQLADMLGQAADSGGGNVFGDLDGNVVYRARDWQVFAPGTPPDGTIGNVEHGHTIPGTPQVDGYVPGVAANTYFVSTPNAPDLRITGDVRITARVRADDVESTASRVIADRIGTNVYAYRLATYTTSWYLIGWPTGQTSPQVGPGLATRTVMGLTPPGADVYVGAEAVGVSPSSQAATLLLSSLRSTDGVGWTRPAGTSAGQRADMLSYPSTVAQRISNGWLGRIYWVQVEAINRATFTFPGVAGNYMSVPDFASGTGDIEIVARCAFTNTVGPANEPIIANRSTAIEYLLRRQAGANRLQLVWTDNTSSTIYQPSSQPFPIANGVLAWYRVRLTAATGVVTYEYAADAPAEPTTWTTLGSGTSVANTTRRATSAPVTIGWDNSQGPPIFTGRIARVIVRNALTGTAATVLDVSDTSVVMLSATTFRAASGQTVTVAQTAGNTIVRGLPSSVIWRFDANDYPGTGLSYVDPRGRTWTLNVVGAIMPKVPAVPPVVVPPDVCPTQWERPFARADLATRVIIGRDQATAQQLDDVDGQTLYGIEPFERTDLLTERDDKITLLGQRILRVRSALSAPRIRSVSFDARTTDAALDLMATVDVFTPSRYRCRLQYPEPRGLVFDAEHFATGVVHEMTPSSWAVDVNLDLAAPYAAAGGRWDGAYWDQATWATPV